MKRFLGAALATGFLLGVTGCSSGEQETVAVGETPAASESSNAEATTATETESSSSDADRTSASAAGRSTTTTSSSSTTAAAGAASSPTTTSSATSTAAETDTGSDTDDDLTQESLLSALKSSTSPTMITWLSRRSDAQIWQAAQAVCAAFSSGGEELGEQQARFYDDEMRAELAESTGLSGDDLDFFVWKTAEYMCPENLEACKH